MLPRLTLTSCPPDGCADHGLLTTGFAAKEGSVLCAPALPILAGPDCEQWIESGKPVMTAEGRLVLRRGEQFLGGVWQGSVTDDLESTTARAYGDIIAALAARPQWHLCRMWNYFPAINLGEGDAERYRRFCAGRAHALDRAGWGGDKLPAASAIGEISETENLVGNDRLIVAFLASAGQPLTVENPRQVSAFNYPRSYGPRSPSFTRAAVVTDGAQSSLFISGTASIVGHQTQHVGDVAAQAAETLRNVDALRKAAADQTGRSTLAQRGKIEGGRVYLRNPDHLSQVRNLVQRHFGTSTPWVFLHSDICRRDLLLEIECMVIA